jgi:hypothetical protein
MIMDSMETTILESGAVVDVRSEGHDDPKHFVDFHCEVLGVGGEVKAGKEEEGHGGGVRRPAVFSGLSAAKSHTSGRRPTLEPGPMKPSHVLSLGPLRIGMDSGIALG